MLAGNKAVNFVAARAVKVEYRRHPYCEALPMQTDANGGVKRDGMMRTAA